MQSLFIYKEKLKLADFCCCKIANFSKLTKNRVQGFLTNVKNQNTFTIKFKTYTFDKNERKRLSQRGMYQIKIKLD